MGYYISDMQEITVTCTDNGKKIDGIIVDQRQDVIRVNMQDVVLHFHKEKKNLFVAKMAGLEFTIDPTEIKNKGYNYGL
jgi:hypothetical protein